MTLDQFYVKLRQKKDKYIWRNQDGRIMSFLKENPDMPNGCPDIIVGEDCNNKTVEDYREIWRAADNREPYDREIRKNLLAALELEEIENDS